MEKQLAELWNSAVSYVSASTQALFQQVCLTIESLTPSPSKPHRLRSCDPIPWFFQEGGVQLTEENAVIYQFLPRGKKKQNVQHSWAGQEFCSA